MGEFMNYEEIRNLLIMKKNQIAMMRLRGYLIDNIDAKYENMSLEDFHEHIGKPFRNPFIKSIVDMITNKSVLEVLIAIRGLMSYHYTRVGEKSRSCAVVYITREGDASKRIKKDFTEALIPLLANIYTNIVIITNKGLTPHSLNVINSIPSKDVGVPRYTWLFRDEEFYTNPLAHKLSPKYELLPEDEAREFRRKYANPLLISSEDPAVKLNGWRINGVVKITRDISSIDSNVKEMISKRLIVRHNVVDPSIDKK